MEVLGALSFESILCVMIYQKRLDPFFKLIIILYQLVLLVEVVKAMSEYLELFYKDTLYGNN